LTIDPHNDPTARWLLGGNTPKPKRAKGSRPVDRKLSLHGRVFLDRFPSMTEGLAEQYGMAWLSAGFWEPADVGRWLDAGCRPAWAGAAAALATAGVPPAVGCSYSQRLGRQDDRWVELVHRRSFTAEFVAELARRSGRIA
jgi:hypothetical protein